MRETVGHGCSPTNLNSNSPSNSFRRILDSAPRRNSTKLFKQNSGAGRRHVNVTGAILLMPRDLQYNRYKAFAEYVLKCSVTWYRYYSTALRGEREETQRRGAFGYKLRAKVTRILFEYLVSQIIRYFAKKLGLVTVFPPAKSAGLCEISRYRVSDFSVTNYRIIPAVNVTSPGRRIKLCHAQPPSGNIYMYNIINCCDNPARESASSDFRIFAARVLRKRFGDIQWRA